MMKTAISGSSTPSVRIQRVGVNDARRSTDALGMLGEWLTSHESLYPTIKRWFSERVVPDLRTSRRVGYIGYCDEVPVLAAVLKQGEESKFCHLSIAKEFQGNRLGRVMFSLMAAEIRHLAKEVHFTLPESLWEKEKFFFQSFGFASASPASSQYRLFDEELRCSAPFEKVWGCVLRQLPTSLTATAIGGFGLNNGLVLSIHKELAQQIMLGRKTVELRKRFADRWKGHQASIYAAGAGSLLGTVCIGDVTKGSPNDIWDQFHSSLGCTRFEFDKYVGGSEFVFAIRLEDPKPYEAPVPLTQLSHLLGEPIRAPQSYSAHSTSDSWGRAISLAALLHSRGTVSNGAPKVL